MVDNNDVMDSLVLQREERKLERSKAKAKAYEENMKNTLAALLKQENVKKVIDREARAAIKDPNRRNNEIFKKAANGTYKDDFEVITGKEPRPWEN